MACIGCTCALIEGYTHQITWVGYSWVACVSGAQGGRLGCAARGTVVLTAGPVPDQRSAQVNVGHVISLGGPALLYMLGARLHGSS